MRADYWLFALLGIANATAMLKRQDNGYEVDGGDYKPQYPEHHDDHQADHGYDTSEGYDDGGYAAVSPDPAPVKSYDPYPARKPYATKAAYPTEDAGYPSKPYPSHASYPAEDYPHEDYPSKDHVIQDYPSKDHVVEDYPSDHSYPTKNYPSQDYPTKKGHYDEYDENKGQKQPWHPKTEHPEFFSLRIDDKCDDNDLDASDCPFDNYAIRLEKGIVIATPYNKWWDPKLPIFFVDDDTQLYTVSKQPLQLYIDTVTGSLRYAPVGWLPPDSIAFSFYKTGNNPLGRVDPSPASLSWPSTEGNTLYGAGPWSLCSLGNTGQFQVFVNADNYGGGVASGVWKDSAACRNESLAAINANPWRKGQEYPW